MHPILCAILSLWLVTAVASQLRSDGHNISRALFESLEELARVVDISYCVGSSGVWPPFKCLGRCSDFEGFELVTTWNTGPLLSDSCGYIAISHPPHPKRVIVAFRGTYSIANTIADLSTSHAEYVPFDPDGGDNSLCADVIASTHMQEPIPRILQTQKTKRALLKECQNCTVHSGFLTSWRNTRCTIIPHVEKALYKYPEYEMTLVGHSLGGAVAALAALEFQGRGWDPQVTTFGEPRIGNLGLMKFIDERFNLDATDADDAKFRRVTHVGDPVPLLPLEEWGFRMHAGEIYIGKPALPAERAAMRYCDGDEDILCIAGGVTPESTAQSVLTSQSEESTVTALWGISDRYKLWQLFFAHRDYFWRLGLCVPGGDPWNWNRHKYEEGEPPSGEEPV